MILYLTYPHLSARVQSMVLPQLAEPLVALLDELSTIATAAVLKST